MPLGHSEMGSSKGAPDKNLVQLWLEANPNPNAPKSAKIGPHRRQRRALPPPPPP